MGFSTINPPSYYRPTHLTPSRVRHRNSSSSSTTTTTTLRPSTGGIGMASREDSISIITSITNNSNSSSSSSTFTIHHTCLFPVEGAEGKIENWGKYMNIDFQLMSNKW